MSLSNDEFKREQTSRTQRLVALFPIATQFGSTGRHGIAESPKEDDMRVTFETMQGESLMDIIAFFCEMVKNLKSEGWDDWPLLFKRKSYPTWGWEEVATDGVRDVSADEAEQIGLGGMHGNLVWCTEGGLYALGGERVDKVLDDEPRWRQWEYHGPYDKFGRQRFLPPELVPNPRAAGRINIISARGTYGRFESSNGFDPLAAYVAAAKAWVRPFTALSGGEQLHTAERAAAAWRALEDMPLEHVETLAALFGSLKKAAGKERRRLRHNQQSRKV